MSGRDSFKIVECFEGHPYLKNFGGIPAQNPIVTLHGATYTTQTPNMELPPYDVATRQLQKNGQACALALDESILS